MMFLFNSNFWYGVLAMVLICFVLWLCLTKKEVRPYVYTLGSLALVAVTAWCAIQLNFYYKAEGGIYGKLSGLIHMNTVEEHEDASFSLKNIVLSEKTDGSYSVTISSSKKIEEFDINQNYAIFVNGEPCSNTIYTPSGNSGTMRAEYHYIFKDDNLTPVCEDVLLINFAYYSNGYQIKLSTEGGQTVVNYWNTYFNRNNFILSIEKFDFQPSDEIEFVEGDTSNYFTVNYFIDDEIYFTQVYSSANNDLHLIDNSTIKSGYIFRGWKDDDARRWNYY